MIQEKATMPVGVFAGIICTEPGENFGKLLLYRRTATTSILTDPESKEPISFRGNFELPGKAVLKTAAAKYGYNHLVLSLQESVLERAGIRILLPKMPAFQAVFFGDEKTLDLAMVTVDFEPRPRFTFTEGRDVLWVNTAELHELARIFKKADEKKGISGEGLVSGLNKRMHCLALAALMQSPDIKYANQAAGELMVIQAKWPDSL